MTAISHHTHAKALAGAFVFSDFLEYYLKRSATNNRSVAMLNPGTIAIIVGLTLFSFAFISEVRTIMKQALHIRRCTLVLETNSLRLQRWRTVRPFVRTGYCGFARALIFQMIDAVNDLLEYKPECVQFQQLRATLYELLEDFPPSKDPPQTGPLFV